MVKLVFLATLLLASIESGLADMSPWLWRIEKASIARQYRTRKRLEWVPTDSPSDGFQLGNGLYAGNTEDGWTGAQAGSDGWICVIFMDNAGLAAWPKVAVPRSFNGQVLWEDDAKCARYVSFAAARGRLRTPTVRTPRGEVVADPRFPLRMSGIFGGRDQDMQVLFPQNSLSGSSPLRAEMQCWPDRQDIPGDDLPADEDLMGDAPWTQNFAGSWSEL